MASIEEIQNEIIEEFEDFLDWEEKYSYIIELGAGVPKLPEIEKTKENIVMGCQSLVWLVFDYDKNNNIITFKADSDALIVKGLVSLLLRIYSVRSPQEIVNTDLFVFDKIGLKGHLSPSRANGLSAMIRDIKKYASKFSEG